MARDRAAGSSPKLATSMVIMMGRSLCTEPSMAAFRMVWPRARSWLMYSSMITPVCTATPNSAKKPMPEETLMWVWVMSSASKPPMGAMATLARINSTHLADLNMVYRIMQITRMVMGSTINSRLEERLALSYSPAQSML